MNQIDTDPRHGASRGDVQVGTALAARPRGRLSPAGVLRASSFVIPLMLLLHLPGVAVGFDVLGPLAIPFGAIVHLALLFGVITELLVSGSLLAKCAVVALVSGMYSNRLLIFTYDITGYAFPAVCLG